MNEKKKALVDDLPRVKFTLPSFAKINLTLRVLGKRADDYHELQTVFQTVTLCDKLIFESLDDGSFELHCDAPDVPIDETNLISRAAKLLKEKFKLSSSKFQVENDSSLGTLNLELESLFGARVTLVKRIPSGGGLGGGSSNAAIALMGLARLWNIKASVDELAQLGAQLGADVPFFLTGGTALGTGRGTEIRALADAPPKELLIITPDVHISTAEAYKSLNADALTKAGEQLILTVSDADGAPDHLNHEEAHNDFERVIFPAFPEIEAARDALIEYGAERAMLSGSGASVFGVFDNQVLRDEACAALRREAIKCDLRWRIFPCATVSRKDYMSAFGEIFSSECVCCSSA